MSYLKTSPRTTNIITGKTKTQKKTKILKEGHQHKTPTNSKNQDIKLNNVSPQINNNKNHSTIQHVFSFFILTFFHFKYLCVCVCLERTNILPIVNNKKRK